LFAARADLGRIPEKIVQFDVQIWDYCGIFCAAFFARVIYVMTAHGKAARMDSESKNHCRIPNFQHLN
jgi:hypothetical protein